MKIVFFNTEGLAVSSQPFPPNALVMDDAAIPAEPFKRLMLVEGAPVVVSDLRGQPAYGGENGRVGTRIPDDAEFLGKDWPALAAYRSDAHPFGLMQEPRPETPAEKKAREKLAADAAVEAEKTRILGLVATSVQFAQACAVGGMISKDEAIAWASSGTLPANLDAAIDAIPDEAQRFAARIKAAGAMQYERASPMIAALGAALGMSEADLDKLFMLAVSL